MRTSKCPNHSRNTGSIPTGSTGEALDTYGVMCAVCPHFQYHGIRNLYTGGEPHREVVGLMLAVQVALRCAMVLQWCYDVACNMINSMPVFRRLAEELTGTANSAGMVVCLWHVLMHVLECRVIFHPWVAGTWNSTVTNASRGGRGRDEHALPLHC